ncbi:hypothetical protein KUO10_23130, partial [Vibrio vulnificus]|nr:hypothetical protein [Vibrio vulnificus]
MEEKKASPLHRRFNYTKTLTLREAKTNHFFLVEALFAGDLTFTLLAGAFLVAAAAFLAGAAFFPGDVLVEVLDALASLSFALGLAATALVF